MSIEHDDLATTGPNETVAFELAESIGNWWPVYPQHFGEEGLRDEEDVVLAPIAHHEQPTRKPLFEAVGPVARPGNEHLLEKSLDISLD